MSDANQLQDSNVSQPQTREFSSNYQLERNPLNHEQFESNFIKTSRYNIITFLPKSLLLQFSRYANVYFLCIAIIQCIPALSTLNPFSAIAPLVFVLGLSMAREGWEDYGRHVSDNEVNATPCTLLKSGADYPTTWANVQVGDYALVKNNEAFPADLIILGSSIPSGACYIETSSLDGEKNLKPKSAIGETQQKYSSFDNYFSGEIKVEAKPPTVSLYELDASLFLPIQPSEPLKKFQLNAKQLLLRGAYLRNTDWIIGIVVYTGQDTKIMKNADPSRIKSSEIEVTMNLLILGILTVQIILSILTACFASAWMHKQGAESWYLCFGCGTEDGSYDFNLLAFFVFFSYMLLYNTMIPISLVVSLEFVKVFQAYFIEKDEEMYVAQRNKYAKAQTTTINEELGQVEYIFSDKTGTLTCNQMEFKYCIIGTTLYGKNDTQKRLATEADHQRQGSQTKIHPVIDPEVFQHSVFNFHDPELTEILQGQGTSGNTAINLDVKSNDGKKSVSIKTQRDLIEYYFFLLCSAHECIVQYDRNNQPNYQGPSPDEITLVDAASRFGFKFLGASASEQNFTILGKPRKVKLLKSFEFDSDRKRMSVIIKDENGIIRVLIKGADGIIKDLLSKKTPQPFLDKIIDLLEEFSKIGLRCLLMATKVLSEEEYQAFDNEFNNLPNDDTRKATFDALTRRLETDLTLIGASAVEDKLQKDVPETIADLLRANIKVWMLTGDKLETAENIAKSCKLIQGDFTVMRLSEDTEEKCKNKLRDIKDTYELCMKEGRKKSILVEGTPLKFILDKEELSQEFVEMAKDCESIVCCRVTPKQKADVVRLIKNRMNKITLAIGDGANDVNMIQAAHIGIGLYGNEGMRAVQSSDFALGEFRCLWRLLLVHGHWNYIRISEMVLYFFYKNMIFTVPQFFYAFFTGFSGQSFFDDWYITLYNLIFTALPLIIRGTFDQDINYRQHIEYDKDEKVRNVQKKQEDYLRSKFPTLYYIGQQKTLFSIPSYMLWAFTGLVHGMIVFFFILWIQDYEKLSTDGYPSGMAAFSLTVYSSIIFIADLKVAIHTKYWTWFNVIALTLCSIFVYFIYVIISNFITGTMMEYTPFVLLKTGNFWLCQFLILAVIGGFEAFQSEILREYFIDPVNLMLIQVQAFPTKLNNWRQKQKPLERQDSFWAGIFKENEEDQELVEFSNSNYEVKAEEAKQGQVANQEGQLGKTTSVGQNGQVSNVAARNSVESRNAVQGTQNPYPQFQGRNAVQGTNTQNPNPQLYGQNAGQGTFTHNPQPRSQGNPVL